MALPTDRRERLLRTAAREFADHGYESASLNRIIKACGMSKSSFYHVFTSKQHLHDAVVADLARRLGAALELPAVDDLGRDPYWRRVQEAFGRSVRVLSGDEAYADLGRILYDRGVPVGESEVRRVLGAAETWVRQLVARGREVGAVRSDLPVDLQGELVLAVLRTLDEWSVRNLERIAPGERDGLADAQFATLRRLLEPGPRP